MLESVVPFASSRNDRLQHQPIESTERKLHHLLPDLLFKRNDGTEGRKDREETVKNCTGIATGISFTGPLLLWNSVQRVPGVRVQQGFSGAAADSGGDQFVDEEFAQTVDLKSHSQAVL